MAAALEFVNASGEEGLARASGADQQHGRGGAHGHALDLFNGGIERTVARGDPGLEEGQAFQALMGEARGDAVVARQVEIDQGVGAGGGSGVVPAATGGCLDQARRQVACLGEQEPANLCHVGTGGDVDQVVLMVGVEGVGGGKVVQRAVDLFEIPGVVQWHGVQAHLGSRRDLLDVGAYPLGEADVTGVDVVDQLQAIDLQVVLLAQADAGAPVIPAVGALADAIQLGPDKPDGDRALVFHD